MRIGSVMKEQRQKLGLTLETVAQATGVTRATAQRWESGVIKTIGQEYLQTLAEILELPLGTLIELNQPARELRSSNMPVPKDLEDDAFKLTVHNEMMRPVLQVGDVLWLSPHMEPVIDGEIVAVRIGLEVYVRYRYASQGGYLLIAANPEFSPILVSAENQAMDTKNATNVGDVTWLGTAVFLVRRV